MIGTAKLLPPSQAVGNLAAAHLTERKVESAVKIEPAPIPAAPVPAEWSEESGSDDDHLLEDIITMGMPSSRQKGSSQPSAKAKLAPTTSATFRPLPKSASAHTLGHSPRDLPVPSASAIPPSHSIDSSLSNGIRADPAAHQSDGDEEEDDDEMLYACIRSAKPTIKPLPPSSSSIKSSSSASIPSDVPLQQQRSRQSRLPMELPKPPASKEVLK